jgi:hypothetical protein
MMLPYFGGVQPGETYYYTPLNYNTLGFVDPSKEGSRTVSRLTYTMRDKARKVVTTWLHSS